MAPRRTAEGLILLTTTAVVVFYCVCIQDVASQQPAMKETSELLKQISLLYKDTYIVYGRGRRSERDLPVCGSVGEACNLAHRRFWLTPITERLCRCPDRSECPIHYTIGRSNPDTQHVTNRAQLKFCGPIMSELPECAKDQEALFLRQTSEGAPEDPTWVETKTSLTCYCTWPHQWRLLHIKHSSTESVYIYTCSKLPKCMTGEKCGVIRADTFESYYTCSCPHHNLCVPPPNAEEHQLHLPSSQNFSASSEYLHFNGPSYTGFCVPNFSFSNTEHHRMGRLTK